MAILKSLSVYYYKKGIDIFENLLEKFIKLNGNYVEK